MNVFNRVVTILLLVVLLLVALALAVFPIETVSACQRGLAAVAGFFSTLQASYFWLFIVGRVLFVLIALILAALLVAAELRPARSKTVRVHTAAGSTAEVTADSVARRLTWHIDQLADVISVTPTVRAHGRSVDVHLDLQTGPEIDVPMKTDEVVALVREVVSERMGLQPGKIEVRIEHVPYSTEA